MEKVVVLFCESCEQSTFLYNKIHRYFFTFLHEFIIISRHIWKYYATHILKFTPSFLLTSQDTSFNVYICNLNAFIQSL